MRTLIYPVQAISTKSLKQSGASEADLCTISRIALTVSCLLGEVTPVPSQRRVGVVLGYANIVVKNLVNLVYTPMLALLRGAGRLRRVPDLELIRGSRCRCCPSVSHRPTCASILRNAPMARTCGGSTASTWYSTPW